MSLSSIFSVNYLSSLFLNLLLYCPPMQGKSLSPDFPISNCNLIKCMRS